MQLEKLLANLNHANSDVRLSVIRTLGMLEETRALPALTASYKREPSEDLRRAISWAGQRLQAAHKRGYATQDEIFKYFGVYRELENSKNAAEAELLEKMQQQLDADLARMKTSPGAVIKRTGYTIAAAAMGGMMMGASYALSSGMSPSGNMGPTPTSMTSRRAPAILPSNADISLWVRRLSHDDPTAREKAANQLVELNNPAALPHLAASFVNDPVAAVRAAAERAGKLIYWRVMYWQMEHDGTLATEMARLHAEMYAEVVMGGAAEEETEPPATPDTPPGYVSPFITPETAPPPPPPPPAPTLQAEPPPAEPQEDIAEILRRAEEARARRQKKGR